MTAVQKFLLVLVGIVVFSGTATAATVKWINGHRIRPHSIPLNRLVGTPPRGLAGVPGAKGATGSSGPPGNEGATGPPGRDGAPGLSGYEVKTGGGTVQAHQQLTVTVICSAGKKVLSGGFYVLDTRLQVTESRPTDGMVAWTVTALNVSPDPQDVTVEAVCAFVG